MKWVNYSNFCNNGNLYMPSSLKEPLRFVDWLFSFGLEKKHSLILTTKFHWMMVVWYPVKWKRKQGMINYGNFVLNIFHVIQCPGSKDDIDTMSCWKELLTHLDCFCNSSLNLSVCETQEGKCWIKVGNVGLKLEKIFKTQDGWKREFQLPLSLFGSWGHSSGVIWASEMLIRC